MSKLLSFLGGNTIEKIGDVVDKLSTSDCIPPRTRFLISYTISFIVAIYFKLTCKYPSHPFSLFHI